VISPDEIVASLRAKLPEDELRATLDQVMAEAGAGEDDPGLDFECFLNMLRVRAGGKGAGVGPCRACQGGDRRHRAA
jgi:hypothetical protein